MIRLIFLLINVNDYQATGLISKIIHIVDETSKRTSNNESSNHSNDRKMPSRRVTTKYSDDHQLHKLRVSQFASFDICMINLSICRSSHSAQPILHFEAKI